MRGKIAHIVKSVEVLILAKYVGVRVFTKPKICRG